MKNIIKLLGIFYLALLPLILVSCKKQDQFLDAKPNQSLVVPVTLNDYQALLNNTNIFNTGVDPVLGEISSDDFYVLPSILNLRSAIERNTYTWTSNIYDAGQTPVDWSGPYQEVFYANTLLDGIPALASNNANKSAIDRLKGSALFFRSYAFYNLVQTFALPYSAATAATEPGIPLRLKADITLKSVRASEADCYSQVISDLKTALPLLPIKAVSPTQPSQAAVNALLARVYLAMSDYNNALLYANNCLAQYPVLNDFNKLTSPTATSISATFLDEDIFHANLINYSLISRRNAVADSNLYAMYDDNDLRKIKYFTVLDNLTQYPRFVGSYDITGLKYSGLATDEIYLIRAECYARTGNLKAAMDDLNMLLVNRWKTGTFSPLSAASSDAALLLILQERRKELIFRGLRWTDLRRLNLDTKYQVTLQRNLDNTEYQLLPNDKRYALPIPQVEIDLSNLTQNPR